MNMFDADKTRMIGLPCGEKNYDNTLSRFHTIPERNGRTDGFAISVSRVSMLTQWRSETFGRPVRMSNLKFAALSSLEILEILLNPTVSLHFFALHNDSFLNAKKTNTNFLSRIGLQVGLYNKRCAAVWVIQFNSRLVRHELTLKLQ